jgi:hypothetical protein
MSTLLRIYNWLKDHIGIAWWPVIATFAVQVDVLGNNFIFDDYLHLYKMSNGPFCHSVLAPHGGHLLSSFNAVVWIVQNLFGANASIYFLLALTIHLASVRLLFEIISRLTSKPSLAAFGAALWGMCPYAEGSIGWMSVNGHVYLTAAILWVVLDIVRFSQDSSRLTRGLLIRDYILLLVAATSFGTGLAAALGFGLVIALWDPLPAQRARLIGVYGSVALATLILYLATMILYGEPGGSRGLGDTLVRNLGHLPTSLALFSELLSIGTSGLLLGPIMIGDIAIVPESSVLAVSTTVSLFAAALFVGGFVVARPRVRRQLLGLLVLAWIGYAMIAFARYWTVEGSSQLIRYHYLPPAILTLTLCLVLSSIADRLPALPFAGRSVFATWLAVTLVPYAMATRPNDDLMVLEQYVQFEVARTEIRRALERSSNAWEVLIPNRPYFVRFFGGGPEDFPGLAAFFVMTYPENIVDGRRVYFLAESEAMAQMARAQSGSRISELLVYRPDAPDMAHRDTPAAGGR